MAHRVGEADIVFSTISVVRQRSLCLSIQKLTRCSAIAERLRCRVH